jgi:ssRNA-specific RNase YbeY (16S rRNA maturation enzyme)
MGGVNDVVVCAQARERQAAAEQENSFETWARFCNSKSMSGVNDVVVCAQARERQAASRAGKVV